MKKAVRETGMQSAINFLFAVLLIAGFAGSVFGQTEKSADPPAVVIPDQALRQIVRRVLIYNFKPGNKLKIIYLAKEGIKSSWLPEIKNIEFKLLTAEYIEKKGKKVYFFTAPEISANIYSISFGFGEPHCNAFGKTWNFRIAKQNVRLWEYGQFGSSCGRCCGANLAGQIVSHP